METYGSIHVLKISWKKKKYRETSASDQDGVTETGFTFSLKQFINGHYTLSDGFQDIGQQGAKDHERLRTDEMNQ